MPPRCAQQQHCSSSTIFEGFTRHGTPTRIFNENSRYLARGWRNRSYRVVPGSISAVKYVKEIYRCHSSRRPLVSQPRLSDWLPLPLSFSVQHCARDAFSPGRLSFMCFRRYVGGKSLPRRDRRRIGPSMRERGEALVHVHCGATAGFAGFLHGMPKRPDLARACRCCSTPQPVVCS